MSAFTSAFEDLAAALDQGAESIVVLPLNQIVEDPANPRSTFDDAEIAALAETVKARGVLQPITVGPPNPDGRYPLRFGARRLRAAKVAGLSEIKALVRSGSVEAAEIIVEQVIENDQRTNLTTADMAGAVARLQKLGKTQAEVGRLLGRPKDQIAMLAAVAKRPPMLEPLGAVLGLRTLYELLGAAKQDPQAVERWLHARDAQTITQADARALAAAISRNKEGGERGRGDARPTAAAPAEGRAPSDPASRSAPRSAPFLSPRLRVKQGRRAGMLLLDRPSEEGRGQVRFDDAEEPELVLLRELKLLSLELG